MSGLGLILILGFTWYSGFLMGRNVASGKDRDKPRKKRKKSRVEDTDAINAEYRDL